MGARPGGRLSLGPSRRHGGRPSRRGSRVPGGCFTEVEEVTSEFLQMYKIHISVHVCGAVSSQAGGRGQASDRHPPPVCPAPAEGTDRGSAPPGILGAHGAAPQPGEGPVPGTGGTQPGEHTGACAHSSRAAGLQTHGHPVRPLLASPPSPGSSERAGKKGVESSQRHYPRAVPLGKAPRPTLAHRRQQGRGGPRLRAGTAPVTCFGQRRPGAGGSGAPAPRPHPHAPTPGARGSKGTGSMEAGSVPRLPPTRQDPPCGPRAAPTCPSCPASDQPQPPPRPAPTEAAPSRNQTKQKEEKGTTVCFPFC